MLPKNFFYITSHKVPSDKIVILLHGYGQTLDAMKPFGEVLSKNFEDYDFILLNGFLKDDIFKIGYKWFDEYLWNLNSWTLSYYSALNSLEDYLKNLLLEHNKTPKDLILIGFSQGAVMALQVGLKMQVSKIVSIAGILMDETVMDNKKQETDILMIQNGADPIVLMDAMKMSEKNFNKYNYKVSFKVIPGIMHMISVQSIEFTRMFLMDKNIRS